MAIVVDPEKEDAHGGLLVSGHVLETEDEIEKAPRSPMEESLVRDALPFMKRTVSKYCDARGQSGPAPADFGDHQPIPIDSICLSPVLAVDESVVDNVPETVRELEQDKSERRTTNG